MNIRAENDPRFSRRFLIMGILALGFSLYCLYDGVIGYPARHMQGFEDFKEDYKSLFADSKNPTNLAEFEARASREDRLTWAKYLHDRNIPAEANIITQYVMAAITAAVGVVLLSIPFRRRGNWIELDDAGLRTSWGQSFHFHQIESINKRRWRDKGLARITYHDGDLKRKFVLDDMMFMRDPTDAILAEIEQKVGFEKITGGPPCQTATIPAFVRFFPAETPLAASRLFQYSWAPFSR
jgi:hypothetical protein